MDSEFHGPIHSDIVIPGYTSSGGTTTFNIATNEPKRKYEPFSNVPFGPDPDFVDRPDITAWIREKCTGPASRAALVGLGGMGKSHLAIQYCHNVREESPQTWVFWVDARTRACFEKAYREIADSLKLPTRNNLETDIFKLVSDWLRDEANGRWTMVLDNADDIEVFYGKRKKRMSEPLAAFLPQSRNGSILFTSRTRDAVVRLAGGYKNIKEVHAMKESQALQLLQNKLLDTSDEDGMVDLVHCFQCIPLAISLAAASINFKAPELTISNYVNKFREMNKKTHSLLNINADDLHREDSASDSVIATWQISFDHISKERRSAVDLLSLSSLGVTSASEHRSASTMPTNYSSLGKQSATAKAMLDSKVSSAITLDPIIELQDVTQDSPSLATTFEVQEPTNNAEEDNSDIYSDAGSLKGDEDDMTEKFAEWFHALVQKELGEISFLGILPVLPELLQEFAIRLGHEGKNIKHLNLMYVAHKPRAFRTIARMLGQQYRSEDQSSEDSGSLYDEGDDEEPDDAATSKDGMDWIDRVNELLGRPNTNEADDRPSELLDPYDTYRQILKNAEATAWLLSTLNQDFALQKNLSSVMRFIRASVLKTLRGSVRKPGQRISRRRNPPSYTARFQLQWDPVAFCDQEFCEGEPRELFLRVITVTGDGNSLQALPCEDYIMQTWPFAASAFIALLQALVAEPYKAHSVSLAGKGGSSLDARLDDGSLHLIAKGTHFEIAEVAEQLAWLGAALQSPGQSRYYISNPELSMLPPDPGNQQYDTQNEPSGPFFRIDFSQSALPLHDPGQFDHSQCWLKLFENMAIVHGFPIPSRPSATPGLEVPLDVAANIIGAEKVVPFKDRLIIKGFSSMLYPTKANFEDGIISWHLIECDEGARIAYTDPRVREGHSSVQKLRYEGLETSRHIVGWCHDVKNFTGTASANYAIRSSSLEPPPRGWVLDKVQIAAGKYLVPAFTFARGTKVRALRVMKERDHIGNMEWLAEKHVILHDTLDRRAWLVDGLSALLHLTRASFTSDSRRFPNRKYSTILDTLREPHDRYTGRIASEKVLTTPENLDLELRSKFDTTDWSEKDDKYRFRDRVKELFSFLEQMIEHQEDMKDAEGVGFMVSRSPWNRLVGFDFIDIARRSDPCKAKGVELNEDGKAWVDFTRTIHAITLFGQGFGDLLLPAVDEELDSCVRCQWNSRSPKHRDTLAVSMTDLEYLHLDVPQWDNEWDHAKPGARTVLQNFIWDRPASTFTPCACVPNQASPARLQAFRKLSQGSKTAWIKKQPAPDTGQVYRTGAVLMGVHRSFVRKAAPSIATDASQSSLLSPKTASREQRRSSLSSKDGSRITSVSTPSTQQSLNPFSLEDIGSSTQATSMSEEDKDQRSTGTPSRLASATTSRSIGKRPVDDRLRLDTELSETLCSVNAPESRYCDAEVDRSLTSSLGPDLRPSLSFSHRERLDLTALRRETLGGRPQLRKKAGKRDLASALQYMDNN